MTQGHQINQINLNYGNSRSTYINLTVPIFPMVGLLGLPVGLGLVHDKLYRHTPGYVRFCITLFKSVTTICCLSFALAAYEADRLAVSSESDCGRGKGGPPKSWDYD